MKTDPTQELTDQIWDLINSSKVRVGKIIGMLELIKLQIYNQTYLTVNTRRKNE